MNLTTTPFSLKKADFLKIKSNNEVNGDSITLAKILKKPNKSKLNDKKWYKKKSCSTCQVINKISYESAKRVFYCRNGREIKLDHRCDESQWKTCSTTVCVMNFNLFSCFLGGFERFDQKTERRLTHAQKRMICPNVH